MSFPALKKFVANGLEPRQPAHQDRDSGFAALARALDEMAARIAELESENHRLRISGRDIDFDWLSLRQDMSKYDPDLKFPEIPIGNGWTAQILWVTPEEAANDWRPRVDTAVQRKLAQSSVRKIAADIKCGRFKLNGETVLVDWNGRVVDGQTRIEAIVAAGVPAPILVVRNLDPDLFGTIDGGNARTKQQYFKSSGMPNAIALAATAKLVLNYENGDLFRNPDHSSVALHDVVSRHPGLEESVRIGGCACEKFSSHALAAFLHYLFSAKDRDLANEFMLRINDGDGLHRGQPIYWLRKKLENTRSAKRGTNRNSIFIRASFAAWNASRSGKTLHDRHPLPSEENLPELI